MTQRPRRLGAWRNAGLAIAIIGVGAGSWAQTAMRVKGTALSDGGVPVRAAIELEAVYGFRGLEFVGQKTFRVTSGDKGQWSLLGVTSGAWVFAAHAPSYLPQVLLLPVQFTQKNPASAVGGQIPWDVGFDLVPRQRFPELEAAADAALGGRRGEVAAQLAAVFETGTPEMLTAAGEIALYARDAGLARAIFERALPKATTKGRVHLGLASASMLEGGWDRATKELWNAREQGLSPRLGRAVGAAITELQRIALPDGRRSCPGGPGC